MKEIKFRAWDEEKKQMEYKDWYDLARYGWIQHEYWNSFVFMRYVGKKDKNEKEIYEKDLIKATLTERGGETYGDPYYEPPTPFWSEKTIIGEVRIRTCGGVGMIIRKIEAEEKDENIEHNPLKIGNFMRIRKRDEVIGNICEDPKLLEDKDA